MTRPSDEYIAEQCMVLKQICFGRPHAEQAPMRNLKTGMVEMHSFVNACDLIRSGLWQVAGDHCDVCFGSGKFKDEVCWHCEGEGIDPSK